jgi:hypothetical protein
MNHSTVGAAAPLNCEKSTHMHLYIEGQALNPEIIADMRQYLADDPWSGLDLDEAAGLAPDDVAFAVDWHYAGGIRRFLADRKV